MRSKAVLVAAGGALLLVVGGTLAALNLIAASLVFVSLGLVALLALGLMTSVRLQSAVKANRERMQLDRRALVAEIRRAAATVSSAGEAVRPASTQASSEGIVESLGNTLGVAAYTGGIGPEFEFAERAHTVPGGIETFALRSKSVVMRDSMARAATNMQFNAEEMLRILRVLRAGRLPSNKAPHTWNPRLMLTLARTLANQQLRPGDLEDADVIFSAVQKLFGLEKFGKSDGYIHAEVLMTLGRFREANMLIKDAKIRRRDPVHAELAAANAHAAVVPPAWENWQAHVNKTLAAEGLSPVRVLPDDGRSALDRLTTDVTPRTVDGPMVTVIVPTFNGSDFIQTTLDCLVRQTWRNVEIIVVDDASEPVHQERLASLCASYPEVRLLQQPSNLGAYPARNRALEVASGAFITVHDDDDWSHPQKLETQANHLVANPDIAANMTRHSRATDGLVFTRINNNPSFSQGNYSSLMFRRELVSHIGPWDDVNRGADAEFRDRIVAQTRQPVELLLKAPLSFTRTHAASLTANEIGRGFIDPSRLFYQAAYERAHAAALDTGTAVPDFPRPLNMLPGNRGRHLGTFDVVFATDFRFPGGTSHLTLNEIEAAAEAGMRVGMIQLLSPLNGGASAIAERALEVARSKGVHVLSLADLADVSLLVVRHPSVLQFAESLSSQLTVGRVVVVINNPPVLTGGRGFAYELSTVRRNGEAAFRAPVEVVAESGVTQSLCRSLFRSFELSSETWPGFVDHTRFVPQTHDFSRRPVLGRHSRDALLKWPALDVLQQVYGSNQVYDVRILGGIESLDEASRSYLRTHADVHGFGALEVPEFLKSLDFWSYFHSKELTESFGLSAVEAMAAGLVVILPKYMKPNFGDAALYCEPKDVQRLVDEYWREPERYMSQSRTARLRAEERFSSRALLSRLGDSSAGTKELGST